MRGILFISGEKQFQSIMDDSLDFTDDEIREELSKLGYTHVPEPKLEEFKKGTVIIGLDKQNFRV